MTSGVTGVRVENGPDGVRTVTLDRPPVNALTEAEYIALRAAFSSARPGAGVACVLLRAEGRFFCAGGDVAAQQPAAEGPSLADQSAALAALLSVRDCAVPVIVAVNGSAAGIGALMPLAADIVVANPAAQFVLPEIDTGSIGGFCGVSDAVPKMLARVMALTGRRMPASRLAEVGTIAKLVPPDQLAAHAHALATNVAGRSRAVNLTDWGRRRVLL